MLLSFLFELIFLSINYKLLSTSNNKVLILITTKINKKYQKPELNFILNF